MKKSLIVLTAILAATSAYATNYTPVPAPTPQTPIVSGEQTQTQSQNQAANASATQTQNAEGGSASVGNVMGGASSATSGPSSASSQASAAPSYSGSTSSSRSNSGDSTSSATNGGISSDFSSKYVNFPQPVWTQVPTAHGCLVTNSTAGALGWNFVSGSKTVQGSEKVCSTVLMADKATAMCQFETAAMLNQIAFEEMYPGKSGAFLVNGQKNLTHVECEQGKRPVMIMERNLRTPEPAVTQTVTVEPAVCPAPVQYTYPKGKVVRKAAKSAAACK